MKKILLSFFIGTATFFATGQIAVTGISPSNIQGNYNFTYADTDNGWAPALDFSIPGTYIQDTLVLVEDGTPGTNPLGGNPISQEGCNTLINASEVAGKIAVIYRNTCEFGLKALNAQNAGALGVIILNRDPEVIGMGAGVSGASVTIPVVMLSSIDGQTLTNEMANGPVVVFIGNKAGLHPNDISLDDRLLLVPPYHGVHSLLAQNGTDFSMDLGLRVYNYGSASQTDATVNAKITNPSGTVVYDQTITFSLDGVTGLVVDSIDIFPGEATEFPAFSLSSYPAGEYTLEYTLSLDGVTDDFPNDNTYSVNFVVNDSYFSRSRLDPVTHKPIATTQVRPAAPAAGGTYSEVTYCSSFRNQNADRLAVLGFDAVVSVDSVDASSSLVGNFVFAEVYEWTNADAVYTANAGGSTLAYQLEALGTVEHSFENNVLREEVSFQFEDPILLDNNAMYLFCISDYGQNLNIGYDREVRYNATSQLTSQWINPLKVVEGSTATWYGAGFGADLTPAYAVRAIDVATVSVKDLLKLEGKAFPNPTSDEVRMIIPLDGKAVISVTDLAGRTVANHTVTFLNNQAAINIADLQSGMYVINVAYENGSKSTFNVVKK